MRYNAQNLRICMTIAKGQIFLKNRLAQIEQKKIINSEVVVHERWVFRRFTVAIHKKVTHGSNITQSSGGKSSSEAFPRNEPSVFLKMLKVLSSCSQKNIPLILHSIIYDINERSRRQEHLFHLFLLLEGFLQLSYSCCICFLHFRYHILLFLPCNQFLAIILTCYLILGVCRMGNMTEFSSLTHLLVSQKQLLLVLFIFGNYFCQYQSRR